MKLFFQRLKIKRLLLKSCRRWSILAPLLLYIILFTLVKYLEIPLKSDDALEVAAHTKTANGNNIIEYLHRLHNLKSNQEASEDYDKIQPFYELEETFHKADYDHDSYLSIDELSTWINAKTQEHIHEAIIENYKVFTAIDTKPKNGLLSWTEYHSYFLQKNGFNKTYIMDHNERHRDLTRSMKEAIMKDKAAWSEIAKSDPDHLTLDEFLSFRHPESSHSTIISLVDEIYRKFDRDGDDILTEEEFSILQTDEESTEEGKSESVHQEDTERRKEFRDMVDLDKDGRATRREMMTYIDPKNPRHAKEEAETLFGLADADRDGRLSLAEIFNKMDLFLGSKMVDTARSFHDEF